MFEIFASTSCSVHRESSAGDTKKTPYLGKSSSEMYFGDFWRVR